ncbi:hypothetical protein ES703_15785 [subsurface metagenome]
MGDTNSIACLFRGTCYVSPVRRSKPKRKRRGVKVWAEDIVVGGICPRPLGNAGASPNTAESWEKKGLSRKRYQTAERLKL